MKASNIKFGTSFAGLNNAIVDANTVTVPQYEMIMFKNVEVGTKTYKFDRPVRLGSFNEAGRIQGWGVDFLEGQAPVRRDVLDAATGEVIGSLICERKKDLVNA